MDRKPPLNRTISSNVDDKEIESKFGELHGRETQIRRDDDKFKGPSVELYDIDYAVVQHIRENIQPTVQENGREIKVPVVYASGEKWSSIQRNGFLRDKNGKIQSPLISIKRNSMTPIGGMAKNDVYEESSNAITMLKKYSGKSRYDQFSVLQNQNPKKELYVVGLPDYIDIDYEIRVWCDYQKQINKIAELMIFHEGGAFGDKNGYKFITVGEAFNFETVNTTGEDRLVTATITLKTRGYLMPRDAGLQNNIQKAISIGKIQFNTKVVSDISKVGVKDSYKIDSLKPFATDEILQAGSNQFRVGDGGSTSTGGVGGGTAGLLSFSNFKVFDTVSGSVNIPAISRNDTLQISASGFALNVNVQERLITFSNNTSLVIPQGTISGSGQITDFGFISESFNVTGSNVVSSSTQISGYNTFLEIEGDNVISSSNQITGLGFISESFNTTGSGIVSSSTQISNYNIFLEIEGDNVVSSSQQITDFGFLTEQFNTSGSGIVSSSTQISNYNTFLEIEGDNVVSSSQQISNYNTFLEIEGDNVVSSSQQITDFGFISESFNVTGSNVISSSQQITDFGFLTEQFNTSGSGILSSSQQISNYNTFLEIEGDNVVSSSNQVDYTQLQNIPFNIISGSGQRNILGLSETDNVEFNQLNVNTIVANNYIVSSSVTHLTTSFSSGSTQFGDTLDDNHTFVGTVRVTGSLIISSSNTFKNIGRVEFSGSTFITGGLHVIDGITGSLDWDGLDNVPNNIVSSSTQISGLGFLTEQFNTSGSDIISGSSQITGLGFISESYTTDGTNILSSSNQISGFNTFLEIEGDSVISSSQQITNLGFITSAGVPNLTNTNVVSSSTQISNYNTFLEISGDNVISSSQQITDFGFVSESGANLTGSNVVSSSNQISGFNTFLEILGDNVISSSNQILPITTSSITNFDTEVSRSVAESGFGSGGGGSTPSGTVSGSQQITDFGFISESYTTDGTGIISSSNQISNYNTFLEISGDNVISSSQQITDFGFVSESGANLTGSNVVSSSNQIDTFGFYKSGSDASFNSLHIANSITASGIGTNLSERTPLVIDVDGNIYIGSDYTSNTGTSSVNMVAPSEQNAIITSVASGSKELKQIDATANFLNQDLQNVGNILYSNIISSSQQITDYGFISESYTTDGTGIVSSSIQIQGYNTFLEFEGDNVISSSAQITGFGFISESFDATGSGIVSSSTQISNYDVYLEKLNDNVISSSAQVDYNNIQNQPSLFDGDYNSLTNIPIGILSSSTQISNYNTFLEIEGDGVISSSAQVDYNNIQNQPSLFDGVYSSLSGIPTGIVSSSTQISNYDVYLEKLGDNVVSSSQQITDFTFISQSQYGTILTGSFTGSFTGTLIGTASYSDMATSASYVESAEFQTAGFIRTGNGFTDNGDGTLTLPSTTVVLYDNVNKLGQLHKFNVTGGTTGTEFSSLSNHDTTHVVVNYNGGSPEFQFLSSYDSVNESDVIPYATVYREDIYLHILEYDILATGLSNKIHERLIRQTGIGRESGLVLGITGSAGTSTVGDDIAITEGYVWNGAHRQYVSASNTQNASTILFFCWESGSAGNWKIESNYAGGFINTAFADLVNYTTSSLDNNKYNTNWIYRGIEEQEHIYLVLGDEQYNSIEKASVGNAPKYLPEIITSHAILVGRIIGQEGTGSAQEIGSAFDITISPAGPIQNHNELSNIDGNGNYHLSLDERDNLNTLVSSPILSSSAQISNLGFLTEQFNTSGSGILSGSQQITDFGFISESYTTDGSGILSSSNQISGYNTFLEIEGDNVVSSSQQITDYGFISESYSTNGTNIVSSSNQISSLGFITEQFNTSGSGIVSSSNQILPILTSSITNFDTEVSRSVAESGFGNFNTNGTNIVSSSTQITDFGFIISDTSIASGSNQITNIISLTQAEYNALGTPSSSVYYVIEDAVDDGLLSSSAQISGYDVFLEKLGDNVISSSQQITDFGFVSESGANLTGSNVVSSSAQISGFNTFLEIEGDNVISSSQQITDFGFVSESGANLTGSNVVSSSTQISNYNTFLEIEGDNVISSSGQISNFGFITEQFNTSGSGILSGSQQITDFGFISESFNITGSNVVSSSTQISGYNTFLEIEGYNVVSSSTQISNLGFITEQFNTSGSGIVSSSNQLEDTFLEILNDNVISGSQQITDFGFISESYSTDGTSILSSSNQISSYNTFLEIEGDNVVSSSQQITDYGFISESYTTDGTGIVSSSNQISGFNTFLEIEGDNVISSSNQILPITTSSITNFDTEVSRSAVEAGFGSSGGSTPSGTVSGSQQITDFGFIISDTSVASGSNQITNIISLTQAEYNALGTPSSSVYYIIEDAVDDGLISSSAQISGFNTFLEISGDNIISSSQQITDFGFISESYTTDGTGIISSSDQILPILTSSITNFDTEVSRSVAESGFGSGGGLGLGVTTFTAASTLSTSSQLTLLTDKMNGILLDANSDTSHYDYSGFSDGDRTYILFQNPTGSGATRTVDFNSGDYSIADTIQLADGEWVTAMFTRINSNYHYDFMNVKVSV